MARRGSVSLIEQHLEKGVLGLAALFTVVLGVYYLGLEPNKVEFGGQKLGPRELDEAILKKAEDLQRAVQNAKPNKSTVSQSARQLQERFQEGLFGTGADLGPPPPRTLPVYAQFGPPLPSLEEGVEADDVAVVTPLKPTSIVARTGISLVYRRPVALPGGPGAAEAPVADDDEGPGELSWVTVGGYFPLEAEQREMINAGYAGYRAKPYVVAVDVQRQEMTANGEFSDWSDVNPSKAMPRIDLPVPAFDDKTGDLVNQAELDERLDLIKAAQLLIMQAPFYAVEAGDEWDVPPLPGHEGGDEAEMADAETPAPKKEEADKPKPRAEARPPRPTPEPSPAGGGGRPGPGGGAGGRPGPGNNPFSGGQTGQTGQKGGNPGKAIKEDLKAARKALKEKDWSRAEQLAKTVANNGEASKSDQAQAKRILRDAEKGQQRQEGSKKLKPTPNLSVGQQMKQVTNPDKEGEPAVWFHDDSVEPGKTYRYRMRVKLWNRYVGRRAALRDPTQAEQTVLVGEWSLPGTPLTVAPKQHFFVRSPALGEPAALVDVFTWHKGNWLKEDFKVRVGDVIGSAVEVKTGEFDADDKPKKERVDFSTGAIVLDLRIDEPVLLRRTADKAGGFAYQKATSLVLVYLDPADGQVKERMNDVDKGDPLLKKLKEEWDTFSKENL